MTAVAAPGDAELPRLLSAVWSAATTRMAGLPIVNAALEVQATPVRRLGAWRFSVVVTPWFMNLVGLPDAGVELPADGGKLTLDLPAGPVEFVVASEPALGRYGAASLFSPMHDFADAEATWATALACLDALFAGPEPKEPLTSRLDRRRLLKLGLGGESKS